MKKAAGYCRVSTEGQAKDGLSLLDQEHRIQEYCEQLGFEIIQIFVERGVSGSTDDRPEFSKMLLAAHQKKFDILVVTDNDRFGRNTADRLRIRKILTEELSIELHSLADGVFLNTPTGRFTDTIKASTSEFYRDLQVEKSASALLYKLSQGQRNLGPLLYGLTWSKDKTSAVHHPTEYPLLRLVVELRLKLKWSYTMVANFLNGKLQDKKGQAIADKMNIQIPSTYRRKVSWDRNKVGYICSQNTQRCCSGKGIVKFKGQEYSYSFPPLISAKELTQLKKVLPDFIKGKTCKRYLLSRKLICGICGGNMQHNAVHRKYQYYSCVTEGCKLKSVRQLWLDNEVWSQLEHLFSDQSQFEHLIFKANAKLYKDKHTLDSIAESIVKIELALQDVDTQIENIIDSICAGSISKELVKTRIDKLKSSKAKLQKEHQEMQRKSNILNKEATTIQQLEKTRLWWASYADQLQDEDKRALIDTLVEKIRVYPFKQYCEDHPSPEDYRTPAIVQVEIIGHIPMVEKAFFGSCKVSE